MGFESWHFFDFVKFEHFFSSSQCIQSQKMVRIMKKIHLWNWYQNRREKNVKNTEITNVNQFYKRASWPESIAIHPGPGGGGPCERYGNEVPYEIGGMEGPSPPYMKKIVMNCSMFHMVAWSATRDSWSDRSRILGSGSVAQLICWRGSLENIEGQRLGVFWYPS